MKSNLPLVIFDLDGTLVDAYKGIASSLNYAMGQMGLEPVDCDAIKRSVGRGDRHLLATFIEEGKVDQALSIFRQHHSRALKDGTAYLPGAQKLVGDLKSKGCKLAIATNRPTRFTRIILKHLHAQETFDYVLCGDKVERPKPAADILMQILKKFDLSPNQAVYVGDMAVDIEAGHNAGIKAVAVATGSSTKEELAAARPYKIIDQIGEILQIIENLQKSAKL